MAKMSTPLYVFGIYHFHSIFMEPDLFFVFGYRLLERVGISCIFLFSDKILQYWTFAYIQIHNYLNEGISA